jgi:multidrug resistance efflux pump
LTHMRVGSDVTIIVVVYERMAIGGIVESESGDREQQARDKIAFAG